MSWMKRRSHVNPNTAPGSHVPLYNPNQHSNQENQWPVSQDMTSTSTNNWYAQQSQNNSTSTQKAYGYNQQNAGQMAPQQHQNYWHQQHDQQPHYAASQQTYPVQQTQYQQGYNQVNYYQNPLDQQPQGMVLNDQYNQQYTQYPNIEAYRQVTQNTEATDTWGNNWGWGDEDNSNVQQNIPPVTNNSNQASTITESFNTEESWNWNVEDSTSTSKNDESSASISQASLDVLTNPESIKDIFPKMGKLSEKHQKSTFETVDNEKSNPNITKIKKLDHLTPQWSTESQMSQESSDDILQTSESDKMLSRSSTISQSPISGQEVSAIDSLPQIEEHDSPHLIKEENENFPTKYIENIEILPQIIHETLQKTTESEAAPSSLQEDLTPLLKQNQTPSTINNNATGKRGESPTRGNIRTGQESPSPINRRSQSPPPRSKSPFTSMAKNMTPPLTSTLNKNITPPPISNHNVHGSNTNVKVEGPASSKLCNITPPPPPQNSAASHQNLPMPSPNLSAKMGATMLYNVLADENNKGSNAFKRSGNVSLSHNKSTGVPVPEGRRSPRYVRSKSPVYNQMNLETVPDNSEQPDNVQVPLARKVSADTQRQGQQGQLPDNNEMISERNQYLETGKLSDENLKQEAVDTLPPPGLRRMVLGQMETSDVSRPPIDEPPPGLSRMVLGQTESAPSIKLGFSRMIPGESSSPETARQYQTSASYLDEPQDSEGEMNQLIASAPQQRSATIGADTPPVAANPNRSDTIIGQDSNQEKDKERPESIEGQPTEPTNIGTITTGMRDLMVDSSSSVLDDPARRKDSSDSEDEDERSRSSRDKRDRRYGRDDRRPVVDKRYSPLENYDRNNKRYDRRRRDRHYEEDTDYYSDRERDKDREEYESNRKYSSLRRDKDKEKERDRDRRRRDGYDRRDLYDREPSRMKKDNYDNRKNSERDYSGYDNNLNNGRDNGGPRERELRGKESRDGYDLRKESSSKDYYERDRKDGRDRKDREYDRDRRDYERNRNKGDYYDRYGRYEDRYDDRSRPSSRSDSMRESFRDRDDERRYIARERASRRHRDFNSYMQGFGYDPYNPYYQQYQMYYENLRRTNPQAYAEWYRKYYQQATGATPSGTYGTEDRASVHSGRSSANDEMKERYLRQTYYAHTTLPHLGGYYREAHSVSGQYGIDESSYSRPYDATDASILDDTQTQRLTPAKFATAHTKASISSGKCIRILPHYPLDGQNAVVEFVNMQKLLINDDEMEELVSFPGPLIRGVTPKKTVIEYCESKIRKAAYDDDLIDTDSYILLWELMILLIRQNGMVVGTDIAELLMKNKHVNFRPSSANSESSSAPNDGNLSDPSASIEHTYSMGNLTSKSEEVVTSKFREYLMYGSGKEALEWAMKHGLWGHALFLASKLDKRSYANVMMRFANGLTMNDPLQTLYQLLSGRLPASVTCVADEKWGDWRPHLAMILSNTTSRPDLDRKAITTMADTLMNRGSLYAAQFCYLMAEVGFSKYGSETAKLVLLGSNHHKPHLQFATNEAIHLTEVYEYACSLNDPDFLILEFQAYKFVIATRLADRGLLEKALSYLERVAMAIIRHTSGIQPHLIEKVSDLADRLKHVDPMGDADDVAGSVSSWLKELKSVQQDYSNGLLYQDNNASRLPSEYDLSHQPTNQYEQEQQQETWQQQQAQGDVFQQGLGQWSGDKGYDHGQQEVQGQQDQQQEVITGYNNNQYQEQPQHFWVNQHQQQWNESSQSSLDQYHHGHLQQPADGQLVENQHHGQHQQGQVQQQDVALGQHQQQDASLSNDYWSNANQQAHNEDAGVRPQISMPNQQSQSKSIFDEGSEEATRDQKKQPQDKPKKPGDKTNNANKQASSGWFGGIFSRLALRPKNQMKLPDDKNPSIVWDPEKKKWVNLEEDQTDPANELKPPPKMSDLMPKMNTPAVGPPGSTVVDHDHGFQGSYPTSYQPNQPDSLTMINNQPDSLTMPLNQPVMYNPSGMQVTGGMPQQQYPVAPVNSASLPTVPGNGDEVPKPNQPNMFKLQRGRNLKKSYVDVFNPSGKPIPAPAMIQSPLMASAMPGGDAQMNFFIPAPVNDPNAPTDFLTPAPVHTESQMSRWSSASSLSREVQHYMQPNSQSKSQKHTHSSSHHSILKPLAQIPPQ